MSLHAILLTTSCNGFRSLILDPVTPLDHVRNGPGLSMLICMQAIEAQAAAGIEAADVLILVMDGQAGFTAADQDIVAWLRKNHATKKRTCLSMLSCMQAIEAQAAAGIQAADVLILVMDGQAGFTAADQDIVAWLRKNHATKPWLLAINKCENPAKADLQVWLVFPRAR